MVYIALAAVYTIDVKEGGDAILKWTIPSDWLNSAQFEIHSGLDLLYLVKKDGSRLVQTAGQNRFGKRISAEKIGNIIEVKIQAVKFADAGTYFAMAKYTAKRTKAFDDITLKVVGTCNFL